MNESYTQRLNLFKKERTWTVMPSALGWEEAAAQGSIAYSDIQAVEFKYAPSRFELRRVSLRIRAQGSWQEITNVDFKGPLQSDRHSEAFLVFAAGFHRALAEQNSRVTYRAGRTLVGYIAVVLVTVMLVLLALAGIALFASGVVSGVVALKLGLIAVFLPLLIKDLITNAPRSYEPNELPAAIAARA